MKKLIPLAFAAALLVVGHSPAGGDKPSSAKQLQFTLDVFEGDPLGSREQGTLKLLASPRIVTLENKPFTFISGGEIAIPNGPQGVQFERTGLTLEGTPGAVKDGKIGLDLKLSNTTVGKETEDQIQLSTETTRMITTVKLGEVVKLRWGKGSADNQRWVELSV